MSERRGTRREKLTRERYFRYRTLSFRERKKERKKRKQKEEVKSHRATTFSIGLDGKK